MVSRDPPDRSLPNSGNKRRLVRPPTLPNFIALRETMYEKSVTKNLRHSVFWRPGAPPEPKFTNLGTDAQQGPVCNVPNFVLF